MKRFEVLLTSALLNIVLCAPSSAGDLRGQANDPTGRPIPGARITLLNIDSDERRSTVADADGRYVFAGLPDGDYLLNAESDGLEKFESRIGVRGATEWDVVFELAGLSDRVLVTGTRIPTPIDQEGRSVSVITAEEIRRRQHRFLYDALRAVPGIQVTRSGSFGALSSVSVRGLESDQTLVVQDGIVLNNPATFGNSFDFANLDTGDIERIEVIKGAQSTLYGSDAIGGVINIVTKEGRQGVAASGFLEGGAFGTFSGGATVRGGNSNASGRVTISGFTTGGFSSADEANGNTEDDGFDHWSVSAKGQARLRQDLTLSGVVRYQDSRNEFDGFAGQPVDGDEVGESQELWLGGSAVWDTFSGRLSHRGSVAYSRAERMNLTDGAPSFDSLGTRISFDYLGTLKPAEETTVVFGAEFDRQEALTEVGFGGNQEIETTSGFGLLQVKPHRRLTLTGGVRHDSSSDFGSETTFNGAGVFEIPTVGLTLRASYSEGFRAPTAGEFGFNPNLFAEFSQGWDVGLERGFWDGRLLLGLTYFDQEVDDLIAFDLADFTFVNIQKFETKGVEASAAIQVHEALGFDLSYTYLDAFNVSTTIASGNQPNHRFNAEVAWRPTAKLTLSGGLLFNGDEPDGVRTLDSFTVLSLRGAYALTDRVEVIARVENLGDADYQDNAGFGTAPVSAFAGLRFRIK